MHKKSELKFSIRSFTDDFGRVFFSNGNIYRAIPEEKKEYCLSFLSSDLFKELIEKKLIPQTSIADFYIEDYPLILEHQRLLETYQFEWTFSMIRNVAKIILEVNTICNKHGYELKDAHMFNVLFRGTKPVWIDIGSISPIKEKQKWIAYEEFLSSVIVPLTFWSQNRHFIAHSLFETVFARTPTIPSESLFASGLLDLLHLPEAKSIFKIRSKTLFSTKRKKHLLNYISQKTEYLIKKYLNRNTKVFSYNQNIESIESLSRLFPIETINDYLETLPSPSRTSQWQNYHATYYNNFPDSYSFRFKRILQHIKSLPEIYSIIDLAGNEGYFSKLLMKELSIERLIVVDYDENAIDAAYLRFKQSDLEEVTTLLFNFMFTADMEGTAKRLKSDLVIALAVTHHLILTSNYKLEAIFERLALFSKKYVVVEFMPKGLWSKGQKDVVLPEWYNLKWFKHSFEKYFHLIVEEQLEENRILMVGKVKNA